MNPIPILIIEDDDFFIQIIVRSLENCTSCNFLIENSKSIKDVKVLSEIFEPEVVLLDLNILDSAGIKTFISVQNLFKHSIIIILSGADDVSLALDLIKIGAQDYIEKSDFSPKLLLKIISFSKERFEFMNQIASSEKEYRDLFDHSPEPMVVLKGKELEIEKMNEAALTLYNTTLEEAQGFSINKFNSAVQGKYSLKKIVGSFKVNLTQLGANSEECYIELHGSKIAQSDDKYNCILVNKTAIYLFELKRMALIFETQEKEKKRIADELHDSLAQKLVLLKLWFSIFDLQNENDQKISRYNDLINECIDELRTISYSLSPPELNDGFFQGIENFIDRMSEHMSFNLIVSDNINNRDFSQEESSNIYRIIQEFTNNSIKHSKGDLITIEFKKEKNLLKINIEDNGIGFDLTKVKKGLGLGNIQNRLVFSQFKSKFINSKGKGTHLRIVKKINSGIIIKK